MNVNLEKFQQVENVKVFFKFTTKEHEGFITEYVDTLLVFPNGEDFLLNPSRCYSVKTKCLYKHIVKSVL